MLAVDLKIYLYLFTKIMPIPITANIAAIDTAIKVSETGSAKLGTGISVSLCFAEVCIC